MKKLALLLILTTTSLVQVFGQCSEDEKQRVMLIGDSWAFFMNADGTFDNVLDHWGHSNYSYLSNPDIAVSGARSEDFLVESRMTEIQNQLESNPDLRAVHISLGGNDFLGEWNVDFTEEETEALGDETFDEVLTLMDFIREIRPDIQIVYSGYMYANFAEIINDVAPFEEDHPFYGNWEEMGFPTFEQINTLLSDFSDRIYELSLEDDQMTFINTPALMQHIYGQEIPLGVDPGGSYPPLFQPLPYGDITYPSPKESMRDYGLFRDCFHLSEEGFFNMIDYQTQKFYHKFLMDDHYLLSEIAAETGSVSTGGDISSTPGFGDNDSELMSTVLSFNTTEIADTVVTGASIFLRRDSLLASNPLGEEVELRMVSGNFGASSDIETADYSDEGDISGMACVFGMNEEDTDWVRIDLPESFFPLITNSDITQFMLVPEEGVGGALFFAGSTDSDFAPVLNLKYKSDFVGLTELKNESTLMVFPNPVQHWLQVYLPDTEIEETQIIDLQGKIVLSEVGDIQQINVENLEIGNYLIRIRTKDEILLKQFVKR